MIDRALSRNFNKRTNLENKIQSYNQNQLGDRLNQNVEKYFMKKKQIYQLFSCFLLLKMGIKSTIHFIIIMYIIFLE